MRADAKQTGGDVSSAALPLSAWVSPAWAGNASLDSEGGSGFRLTLPQGRPWAAAVASVPVDLTARPILTVTVSRLSPGAAWVVKLDDAPYDPAHPHDVVPTPAGGSTPGTYLVDLRELSGAAWEGRKTLDVRLFVTGQPGASVTFGRIAFLPAPPGVEGTVGERSDSLDAMQVSSGTWTMRYLPDEFRLQLRRVGSREDVGLSIALPGFTRSARASVAPAIRFETDRSAANQTGQSGPTLRYATETAEYEVRFFGYPAIAGKGVALFRWTVTATWLKPHALDAADYGEPVSPECAYASAPTSGLPLRVLSGHRFGQAGMETGQAFLPCDPALGGTGLYVQNLTALGPLFDATHTSAAKTVTVGPEGFGFRLNPPVGGAAAPVLPTGTRLRLADSFLALAANTAGGPDDAAVPESSAHIYLHLLATVYDALPDRPDTVATDWHALAERSLADLLSPACWSNPQKGYLRNYVGEAWTPNYAELLVQVDPLVASLLYSDAWNLPPSVVTQRVTNSLPEFYSPARQCLRDDTIQTDTAKADSWYRIYPQIQLARAAERGVGEAKTLVRNSLDTTIALAHACDYHFPVFFNPHTLGDFTYAEPDAGGAYAYLMLQAHDLFGDARYLDEARRALAPLREYGLNFAYELHLTGLSAAACARMWKATGDRSYLTLSEVPVANVLRHCWIYEPGYGFHKNAHLFFTLSAMPGTYAAAFEQYQTWLALREYDDIAHDALPDDIRLLVGEFLKYGQTNLRAFYPAFMPPGELAPPPRDGSNRAQANLLIPVEDLNDGWDTSGKIGQEIYGAGGPLALAARAYVRVPQTGLIVWSEYSIREHVWNADWHILRLHFGGVAREPGAPGKYTTRVVLQYDPAKAGWTRTNAKVAANPRIQVVAGDGQITDRTDEPGKVSFRIEGETTILVDAAPPPAPLPKKR